MSEPHRRDYYGCVRCQRNHFAAYDPEYDAHLFFQSKHGVQRADTDTMEQAAHKETP